MAQTAIRPAGPSGVALRPSPVARVRLATIAALLMGGEALARSGLLYQDVVPSVLSVAIAFVMLLTAAETYHHLAVTGWEVIIAFVIGTVAGTGFGILMGVRRLFGIVVAPYVDALATAPKIIFLPIAMLLFGIGVESKIALGALSCFFPVVLNTAAGMQQIRPVLIRVGRSFNATMRQMVMKIYLPALARPLVTGMRLGLGVTIVGVLLAEIKLSNAGLGYLAIEQYNHFRIPEMYALLLLIFILAVAANVAIGRSIRAGEHN